MPPTPSQIKELLLSAIDKDENIVDMGSVTKAVALLESNPITKDALEETRLGRLIKIVRKKATTSNLKKRCTALIKQWQSQFLPQNVVKPPKNESPVPNQDEVKRSQEGSSTSEGQKPKPANQTTNTLPVDKSKSENLRRRKREKECSPSISPSSQGPPPKRLVSSQGHSPSLTGEGNGQDDSTLNGMSAKEEKVRGRTAIKDTIRTASPKNRGGSPVPKPSSNRDKGSLKKLKQERSASPKNRTKDIATNSISPNPLPSKQLQVSNKEEKLSPRVSSDKADKRLKISPGSSSQSPARKSKYLSNEKSPRQLNHSSSSNSPFVKGGSTSLKPTSVFGTDWDSACLSPSVSGGQLEASNAASTSSKSLSIFDMDFDSLQPEVASSSLLDVGVTNSPPISEDEYAPVQTVSAETPVQLEECRQKEIDSPRNCEALQKVSIQKMETLEDDPLTPPAPVLEGDIDRIHDENWEGVNGCYNYRREWSDWMQCLTVNIDEEHSLQILPYVCID